MNEKPVSMSMKKLEKFVSGRSYKIHAQRENDSYFDFSVYEQHNEYTEMKPRGLWYSCGNAWLHYANRELSNTYDDIYRLMINMTEIYVIDSENKLNVFVERFGIIKQRSKPESNDSLGMLVWRLGNPEQKYSYINWSTVSLHYKGIEVNPFVHRNTNASIHHTWYDSFDVSSGCIWDLSCITSKILMATKEKTFPLSYNVWPSTRKVILNIDRMYRG